MRSGTRTKENLQRKYNGDQIMVGMDNAVENSKYVAGALVEDSRKVEWWKIIVGAVCALAIITTTVIALYNLYLNHMAENSELAVGTNYKLMGEVKYNDYKATINAVLKVEETGEYKVELSIYSKDHELIGSHYETYSLAALETVDVSFEIINDIEGVGVSDFFVTVHMN